MLKKTLTDKLMALIDLLMKELRWIEPTVAQTSQKADKVLNISLEMREATQKLQMDIQSASDCLLTLEAIVRDHKLKLRGFSEEADAPMSLTNFIAKWLAEELKLREGDLPAIMSAYRPGPPNMPHRKFPRDVLIKMVELSKRNLLLDIVCAQDPFRYKGAPVLVFPDIPPEAHKIR